MPPVTVLHYQTPHGNQPVADYLGSLKGRARAAAAALVRLLANKGRDLRLPESRALGNGLFELRDVATGVRLFYMFLPNDRAVLLDGLTKKRTDIPAATLERIRQLQRAVLAEAKRDQAGKRDKKE